MIRLIVVICVFALAACSPAEPPPQSSVPVETTTSNTVIIDTAHGPITIKFRPDLAPNHVNRIKQLTQQGFYNGVVFHRVIEGFMAQTGDPTGTGRGGSDLPDLEAEFSSEPFKRGVVGMARAQSPNSANSQFFIMLADGDFLNGQYTVFGDVIEGMDAVDAIKKGDRDANGSVTDPDKIIEMRIGPASS